jgi:hypothetical protein
MKLFSVLNVSINTNYERSVFLRTISAKIIIFMFLVLYIFVNNSWNENNNRKVLLFAKMRKYCNYKQKLLRDLKLVHFQFLNIFWCVYVSFLFKILANALIIFLLFSWNFYCTFWELWFNGLIYRRSSSSNFITLFLCMININ